MENSENISHSERFILSSLSHRPGAIDYRKFTDAIERAMAQEHMEKSPLTKPAQHVPSKETPRSFLNFDERQILMRALDTLTMYTDRNLEEVFQVRLLQFCLQFIKPSLYKLSK